MSRPSELAKHLKHAVLVFNYVSSNEGCSLTEISKKTGLSKETVRNTIRGLVELGLVTEKVVLGPPRRMSIMLTEKGKKALPYMNGLAKVILES